jgi:hypothetical protein
MTDFISREGIHVNYEKKSIRVERLEATSTSSFVAKGMVNMKAVKGSIGKTELWLQNPWYGRGDEKIQRDLRLRRDD